MKNDGALKVTTPSDREIAMTRVFNAPRKLVFDALTKPELIKRWLLGRLVDARVRIRAESGRQVSLGVASRQGRNRNGDGRCGSRDRSAGAHRPDREVR